MAKRILIIEDYEATVEMLTNVLELNGYEVNVATDGPSGLKKAASGKPALILLDIMMPEMSGIEICQKLKSEPKTKQIPIIIVSVKATDEDVKKGLACGADAYITKPFDPFDLIEKVQKYLEPR
jgi:CheY-like chemotaxis protein